MTGRKEAGWFQERKGLGVIRGATGGLLLYELHLVNFSQKLCCFGEWIQVYTEGRAEAPARGHPIGKASLPA